jgi:hypothetical protein
VVCPEKILIPIMGIAIIVENVKKTPIVLYLITGYEKEGKSS